MPSAAGPPGATTPWPRPDGDGFVHDVGVLVIAPALVAGVLLLVGGLPLLTGHDRYTGLAAAQSRSRPAVARLAARRTDRRIPQAR